jgi:hypothetical protein
MVGSTSPGGSPDCRSIDVPYALGEWVLRHVLKPVRPRPTSAQVEGSGTAPACCWNTRNVGPPSVPLPPGGPLLAAMKLLMNAPVVPLLVAYRLPSGPNVTSRPPVVPLSLVMVQTQANCIVDATRECIDEGARGPVELQHIRVVAEEILRVTRVCITSHED